MEEQTVNQGMQAASKKANILPSEPQQDPAMLTPWLYLAHPEKLILDFQPPELLR